MDSRALFNLRTSQPPLDRSLKYHHRSQEGGCCGFDRRRTKRKRLVKKEKRIKLLPYRTLTRMKSDLKKEGKNG
jgi:hypothetical protein